ncbi:hypothetical protein ACFL1B_03920 [Nanoarchaeota archaeon]
MARKDKFNQDMGAYLKSRRRREDDRGKVGITVKSKPMPEMEDVPVMQPGQVHVEYERPGFWRRIFAAKRRQMVEEASDELSPEEMNKLQQMEAKVEGIEEEMTEMEEMEEELEHERESIIDKIMGLIGLGGPKYEDIDDFDVMKANEDAVDKDMKQVLKLAHRWLEKLPSEHKKDFKESEDFQLYLATLEKYGLIKQKK